MSDPKGPQTKRVRIGGDELHEITIETIGRGSGPSTPVLPGKYRLGHKLTFWEDLAAIARDCEHILSNAGLPTIEESKGFSGPYRKSEPLSEAWFAVKIGLMCRDIRQGKETPSEWTLERTLNLGRLLETRDWRREFKKETVEGIKASHGRRTAAWMRRGKLAPDTLEILDEMNRLIEIGLSKNSAARHVARKFGKGQSAVRSLWYRHLQ